MYNFQKVAYTSGFDFNIQSGSPVVGKGNSGVTPLAAVPVDEKFGASEITAPGADIGAYQANGKGNKH